MITRNTFRAVLDEMKAHYDVCYRDCDDVEYDLPLLDGSILTAETTILKLISEAMNDYDDLISDWVHGHFIADEEGNTNLILKFSGNDAQFFCVRNAGDLYDYLILLDKQDYKTEEVNTSFRRAFHQKRRHAFHSEVIDYD